MKLFLFQDNKNNDVAIIAAPKEYEDKDLDFVQKELMPKFQFNFIGLIYVPGLKDPELIEEWRTNFTSIIVNQYPDLLTRPEKEEENEDGN